MTFKTRLFAIAASAALIAPAAMAQDFEAELKARQGQFRIMALNLGVLGGMAQGKIDYDAEQAQAAADNLAAITTLHQTLLWPEGSDAMMLEGTRAEPSIWDDNADFLAKWSDLGEAAQAMQAAAGQGREAIGPALQQVGGACKACHDAHRTPDS